MPYFIMSNSFNNVIKITLQQNKHLYKNKIIYY